MRGYGCGVLLVCLVACGDDGGGDDAPDGGVIADPPELDLSLREQVTLMEDRALTSADLTAAYLARIDRRRLDLNAFILLAPDAEATAATLDDRRGNGALLQGAVIGVKDNIDTANVATTAGSLAMTQNVPSADAPVIAKLREANAVMVGKTNLSEWANFRGYQSSSGWSSRGGQTNHALLMAYNPCGSSSGSGVAVKAGLVSAALGTETSGSIICPSAINGIVGFKPTVGLVSRTGVIPISDTFDTVGPMTRTVGDAARLLRVIAGPDSADPATAAIPANFDFDFEAALSTDLSGVRIGVVRNLGHRSAVQAVFDQEVSRLADAGAILVDVSLPSPAGSEAQAFFGDVYQVEIHEFKTNIDLYLDSHRHAGQPTTLAELIAYNSANAGSVMPFFGQQVFTDSQSTGGKLAQAYLDAKPRVEAFAYTNGILQVLDANNLAILISPSEDPAWLTNHTTGDAYSGASSSSYPAAAGSPHLTVPMGSVGGLPVGMSFYGRRFDDARVLAIGYAYEQRRGPTRTAVDDFGEAPVMRLPRTATIGR